MQLRKLKSTIILLVFVFTCHINVLAQNMEVKGRIVDAETNKAVEFANLGIVNSYMGTASDFNGEFNLLVSSDFENHIVRISAVGYRVRELTLKQLKELAPEALKLFPQSYGINQVEVKAASKRLYGILKTAANVVSDNYADAYSSKVYFSQKVDDSRLTELALYYTDADGYNDRSFSNAFEKRSYKVGEVRRDFELTPIIKGMIYADEVLEFDVARMRGNVLDADVIDGFDLSLKETAVYNKDSVWVISYRNSKSNFASTGTSQAVDYEGVVYVSQSDYAVLRNEFSYTTNGFHIAGRSSGLLEDENNPYTVSVVVDYRKMENGKYALSKIDYQGTENNNSKLNLLWIAYDFNDKNLGVDSGRVYYTSKDENLEFWNKFVLPPN